ncbi:MAG: hypothetical protein E7438_05065 [Ruminococcaceae bacterium]|nr:hypothetical protein [Oscillospiraceae bacterium]
MFGYVSASLKELSPENKQRYSAIYCGICRCIRSQASQTARLSLSYDMTFLALLLMSLYEPEEQIQPNACLLHPIKKRPWVDSPYIRYAADMNIALAYHNCMDDWNDDRNLPAKLMANMLQSHYPAIADRYRRQCDAMERCIAELSRLEKENCANPDEAAGCFGQLMGELLVYEEDFWAPTLRELGMALGRFIYLADAAIDYRKDARKKKYNPYLAMGTGLDWPRWEEYLVLAMGRCTDQYERLPLVQDKAILDNILYSGVWTNFGKLRKKAGEQT